MRVAGSGTGALGQIGRAGKWLMLLGTIALSACQVVPKGPPRPIDVPPPVTIDPVGPALPTDNQRNRVALLVPLTGPNAAVGESISNAANMAVLDTGGKTIRVTMYDTATGAAAAAQKAVAEGNRLILGPLLADDVRIVAPIARAARVPVVTFSNDVGVAGNGVYVMGFAPAQSIERVVAYARSKGATKFAGLVPSGLYGQRSSTAFLRSVEAAGGQVVSLQTFDRSAGSITAAFSFIVPATFSRSSVSWTLNTCVLITSRRGARRGARIRSRNDTTPKSRCSSSSTKM